MPGEWRRFEDKRTWIICGKGPTRYWVDEYRKKWPDALVGTVNDHRVTGAAWHADVHRGRDETLRDLEVAGVPVVCHASSALRTAVVMDVVLEAIEGEHATRYLSSSVAILIAWALLHRPERICLPGVDYHPGTRREAEQERPGTEWWLGYAWAQRPRVAIEIPPASFLMTGHGWKREVYPGD